MEEKSSYFMLTIISIVAVVAIMGLVVLFSGSTASRSNVAGLDYYDEGDYEDGGFDTDTDFWLLGCPKKGTECLACQCDTPCKKSGRLCDECYINKRSKCDDIAT